MNFLLGLLVGVVATGLAVWMIMPKLMITVHESSKSVDETAAAVEKAALDANWKVPKVYDIKKTMTDAGYDTMTPLKIVSICQPDHAYDILQDDKNKFVSAIMPCRIAIYEAKDGKTYLAEMNMGLMSKMFGGIIARIIGKVSQEEQAMIEPLIKK